MSGDQRFSRSGRIFAIAAIAVLAQLSTGQDRPSFTLAGEVELSRLVDLAAEHLDINIEYDPSQLRGSVTFRLGTPVTDDELWALTNRLLAAKGFTTIRRPGEDTVGVVPISDASGLARIESGGDEPGAVVSGYRVVAVETEHAMPDSVVSILQAYTSGRAGSVSRVPETDVVILSDLSPRVEQMLEVLRRLDVPGSAVEMARVPLGSATSATLLPRLTQLVAKRQLSGAGKLPGEVMEGSGDREVIVFAPADVLDIWRLFIETLDHAHGVETRTYRPRFFALEDVSTLIDELLTAERPDSSDQSLWRIVENTLTGSLVITATPAQHSRISSLLDELADAPPESRQPLRTFVIRNRNAEDVRQLLVELLQEGLLLDESSGTDPAGASTRPTVPLLDGTTGFDQRLRLSIDPGTNTLIAAGEPRLLDQVGEIIDQIDVRRPQVMVEVLLISLTEGQTLDLGVELQQLVSDSGTLVALGSLFGLSDITPFGGSGADSGSAGSIQSLPAPGGTAVVLDPGDFSAVVRALETISDGRSLSMPRVLVNDNESANIDSVVQEPFTSTNASDTVATTSFGGFESAGTTVTVTPQIAEGDHLTLQYAITLSSFTGESPDASTPPPRQQNSISSVATIPDGHTIAVGGIELVSDGDAESRVPLIGQIPLVGELFKSRSKSGSRSRFFAFIRSDVMRHESFDDLKFMSRPAREAVDVDDDFPTLAPRIIR